MKELPLKFGTRTHFQTFTFFVVFLIGLFFFCGVANAALVEITASGEIGTVADYDLDATTPFDSLTSGDLWSFRLVYESDTPEYGGGTPAGYHIYPDAVTFAEFTIASEVYSSFNSTYVYWFDEDSYTADALGIQLTGDGFRFNLDLKDLDATVFSEPGTLPASIDLSEFETYVFAGQWMLPDGTGDPHLAAAFNTSITTIEAQTISNVPIPGAAWLFSSGIVGLVAVRRKFRK
jgi:hypothetical protein